MPPIAFLFFPLHTLHYRFAPASVALCRYTLRAAHRIGRASHQADRAAAGRLGAVLGAPARVVRGAAAAAAVGLILAILPLPAGAALHAVILVGVGVRGRLRVGFLQRNADLSGMTLVAQSLQTATLSALMKSHQHAVCSAGLQDIVPHFAGHVQATKETAKTGRNARRQHDGRDVAGLPGNPEALRPSSDLQGRRF